MILRAYYALDVSLHHYNFGLSVILFVGFLKKITTSELHRSGDGERIVRSVGQGPITSDRPVQMMSTDISSAHALCNTMTKPRTGAKPHAYLLVFPMI